VEPGSSDFNTFSDWTTFASTEKGNGASISRYWSADDLSNLRVSFPDELQAAFDSFAPLFDYLYAEANSETHSLEIQETPARASNRIWAISLGERGRLWNECQEKGIIAIGWRYLGDLRNFADQAEIANAMQSNRGEGAPFPTNDSLACYEFVNSMSIGDIVVAKIGLDRVLGVGTIQSEYTYLPDVSEYHHVRKVNWLKAANLDLPLGARVPLKTLTEVTNYHAFVEFIRENLLGDAPITEVVAATPRYTIDDVMNGLFLPRAEVEEILTALSRKKNVLLQGPPGVGKTYIARRLAHALIGQHDDSRVEMIQFHQSYSYEDFIQGYRPSKDGFIRRDGIFYDFCNRARLDRDRPFVFIIDEINRGNLSKIFGELMMLIEHDKRGPHYAIPLTYSETSGERFSVPDNVHLIGLMNTADRSLSIVDYALRRRFVFFELLPQFDTEAFQSSLRRKGATESFVSNLVERLGELNRLICKDDKNLGRGFAIGHSYFCAPEENRTNFDWNLWFRSIVEREVGPLLQEYWFDDQAKAKRAMEGLLH
jgi:MoxR-like ATPase